VISVPGAGRTDAPRRGLLLLAAVPRPGDINRGAIGLVASTLAAVALSACGGSGGPSTSTHKSASAHRGSKGRPAVLSSLSAAPIGSLPAAVEDAAVAPVSNGRLALLGGIDSSQTSTDSILLLNGASASQQGTLPNPQHDAQAATLGPDVYVFGGGQLSSYDHILRYDPSTGGSSQAGALPAPASDVAVVSIGNTAYIIGGYTGASWLDTIVAWTPGSGPRVVARLPAGLRYAAVAVAGNRIIIAGGTAPSDTSTDAILSFDPASGAVTPLGHLPFALTHASAVFLDGRVVVVGGRREVSGGEIPTILAINPTTGAVSTVGQLPQPLSDAAVALDGNRIVVAGGDNGNGPQSAIIALTPRVAAVGG
jgi:N-acetylneuraminic acid mutarotase